MVSPWQSQGNEGGIRRCKLFIAIALALRVVAEKRKSVFSSGRGGFAREARVESSLFMPMAALQKTNAGGSLATGMCITDTARPCVSWKRGNIIDHTTQCAGGGHHDPFLAIRGRHLQRNYSVQKAWCSANNGGQATRGSCICATGFCADIDMRCHRGLYSIVSDVFTITTKRWGINEVLYMAPDGIVKIGTPPDPRAARWRISVTRGGAKILWPELYTNSITQDYERCTRFSDSFGMYFTKCSLVVGSVATPRANEMGWYIEEYRDSQGIHVQLRSVSTWNMLFIDSATKEGRACEMRTRNCPGVNGAFRFDPPLFNRMDLTLDIPTAALTQGLDAYFLTASMAIILACCLGCACLSTTCTDLLRIPVRSVGNALARFCGCEWWFKGAMIGGKR